MLPRGADEEGRDRESDTRGDADGKTPPTARRAFTALGDSAGRARDGFERVREVARGAEALIRILLEAAPEDSLEGGRHMSVHLAQGRRVFLENRGHRLGGGLPLKGSAAGEHLVQHASE